LLNFLESGLQGYAEGRDAPAQEATSRLSPHLRFGEISPRQIWHAVRNLVAEHPELAQGAQKFLREVVWCTSAISCCTLIHTCRKIPRFAFRKLSLDQ
jgi:deoxyribodipyrimidine photo-lyase